MNRVFLQGIISSIEKKVENEKECVRFKVETDDDYHVCGYPVIQKNHHMAVIYGKLSSAIGQKIKEGELVLIEGRLGVRKSFKDNENYYISETIVENIDFLKKNEESPNV